MSVNINVVVDEKLLASLRKNVEKRRLGYYSKVKRTVPQEGIDVTVPDEHDLEAEAHQMSIAEFIEFFVYQSAKNRL